MPSKLREIARDFGLGDAPLEAVRQAALKEPIDRVVADALLKVIADWERGGRQNSPYARNELRERVQQIVPAAPEPSSRQKDYTKNMYDTGLRGQRR